MQKSLSNSLNLLNDSARLDLDSSATSKNLSHSKSPELKPENDVLLEPENDVLLESENEVFLELENKSLSKILNENTSISDETATLQEEINSPCKLPCPVSVTEEDTEGPTKTADEPKSTEIVEIEVRES